MNEILQGLRWQDGVDIAIVAVFTYSIALQLRGTRAARMLIGILAIVGMYLGSQYFELYTLNWILGNVLSSMFLVIIVIFQNDIRRALTQFGARAFSTAEPVATGQVLEEIVRGAVALAAKRIGALIVIERDVGLNEYIEVGTRLDSKVTRELIQAIFLPASPIHDGALMIQRGRLTAAGCFLPLTSNPGVAKSFGTRHRAAIGLTEETDALVTVVSEEDGKISLVRNGKITRDLDAGTLRKTLQEQLS